MNGNAALAQQRGSTPKDAPTVAASMTVGDYVESILSLQRQARELTASVRHIMFGSFGDEKAQVERAPSQNLMDKLRESYDLAQEEVVMLEQIHSRL